MLQRIYLLGQPHLLPFLRLEIRISHRDPFGEVRDRTIFNTSITISFIELRFKIKKRSARPAKCSTVDAKRFFTNLTRNLNLSRIISSGSQLPSAFHLMY